MHIISAKTNSRAVFQFNVETLLSNHTIPLHEVASSYFGVGLRAILIIDYKKMVDSSRKSPKLLHRIYM